MLLINIIMANVAILHSALEPIGRCTMSRNAFTDEGFDSIQQLNTFTQS